MTYPWQVAIIQCITSFSSSATTGSRPKSQGVCSRWGCDFVGMRPEIQEKLWNGTLRIVGFYSFFIFLFFKKILLFFLGWGFGFWVFLQRKFSSMISSGINLVMTVIGFAVSTTFIVFVCTRLVCARIHLNATRRSFPIASRSNLSIVSLFFMLFGSPFLSLFIR